MATPSKFLRSHSRSSLDDCILREIQHNPGHRAAVAPPLSPMLQPLQNLKRKPILFSFHERPSPKSLLKVRSFGTSTPEIKNVMVPGKSPCKIYRMNILKQEAKETFLQRFYNCDDGVVRSIAVVYPLCLLHALRSARKRNQKRDGHSVSLRRRVRRQMVQPVLELFDVKELAVAEKTDRCHTVLFNGLNLAWFNDVIFVDLSSDENDFQSAESFRKVSRYFAATLGCKSFRVKFSPSSLSSISESLKLSATC